MSYDFAIEVDTGGAEPLHIEPRFDDQHPTLGSDGVAGTVSVAPSGGYLRCGNYTSNVSRIWTRCLTEAAAVEFVGWWETGHKIRMVDGQWQRANPQPDDAIRLADLAGKECAAIAPLFAAAVEWGIDHLAELRQYEPDNGWGNAEGAITYLWDIQRMCEAIPKATLYVAC